MHSYKRIYIVIYNFLEILYIIVYNFLEILYFKSIEINANKKERQSLTSLTLNEVQYIPLLPISGMPTLLTFSIRNVASCYHTTVAQGMRVIHTFQAQNHPSSSIPPRYSAVYA